MGLSQAKPSVNDEIAPFIPYLVSSSSIPVSVDPNVKLEVRPSTMESGFIEGYHNGLFSKYSLKKGTIICQADNNISRMMNDAMVNLEPVLRSSTSVQLYDSLTHMKNTYNDLSKAQSTINVNMLGASNGTFFQTIKDVPAGGELMRMYGFSTWTLELFEIINNHNVAGFAKFITELKDNLKGDPYEIRAANLHAMMKNMFPDMYEVSLERYDEQIKSQPLTYVGKEIEKGYTLFMGLGSLFQS
ncbi:Hypothetical protein HVR_LOCUS470 [uncultured virus]|nr:Hypothetical protein HVR_LOCUS470 [uncultured virus]